MSRPTDRQQAPEGTAASLGVRDGGTQAQSLLVQIDHVSRQRSQRYWAKPPTVDVAVSRRQAWSCMPSAACLPSIEEASEVIGVAWTLRQTSTDVHTETLVLSASGILRTAKLAKDLPTKHLSAVLR